MIPTNFSLTNRATNFIHQQRETKERNLFIRFAQRELITRVAGAALPIFSLLDTIIHTFGAAECSIKGLVSKKQDFSDAQKHFKCVKIFSRFIWLSLFYGIAVPSILISYFDDDTVACVNALLLSQNPEYAEHCVVDCLKIVKYIKKRAKEMAAEDLTGMEASLKLLSDADKYLRMNDFQTSREISQIRTTQHLGKLINTLRTTQGSFIKTIIFKECLARLVSIGLSITSAIDLTINIFTTALFLVAVSSCRLLFGKKLLLNDTEALVQYALANFRDSIIHAAGALTASLVGVIHPEIAVRLADPASSWYRKLTFKGEHTTEIILSDLENLKDGESSLIPISFSTKDSGHIIYCVVDKINGAYEFSTLNTGYGSNYAEAVLKILTGLKNGLSENQARIAASGSMQTQGKVPANYTFRNLTFTQVSTHVKSIQKLAHKTFRRISKEAKKQQTTAEAYSFQKIYPASITDDKNKSLPESGKINSQGVPDLQLNRFIMFSKEQAIGDCPKSSLLAALNYHSSRHAPSISHQAYDRWVRRLKDHVLEKDGFLIDLSFSLKNYNGQARKTAKERVEDSWLNYTSRYCAV